MDLKMVDLTALCLQAHRTSTADTKTATLATTSLRGLQVNRAENKAKTRLMSGIRAPGGWAGGGGEWRGVAKKQEAQRLA